MIVLHRVFWSSWCLFLAIAFWLTPPVWAVSYGSSVARLNSGLDNVRQQNYQQALIDFITIIILLLSITIL